MSDNETSAPDVSVVLPAHDVAPWIEECLRSILGEERIRLEVIVIDDHSSDETYERAAGIAATDSRVRVVAAEGRGGGQARNQGARLARGAYLMFCDADDLVAPDGILRMFQAARLTRAEMVVANFLKFSASYTWSPTARWKLFNERRENVTLLEVPDLIRNRACWNRLLAREFWEREAIRFPTVPRSNDIVPMTLALTGARNITILPDVVYLYRERPGTGSMTSQAGSTVGSISYLSEERKCKALIDAQGDETLNAVYWGMLLDSDTWVQAERYITYLAEGGEPSSEVESLIAEFISSRRDRSWDRIRAEKQGVLSLVAGGHRHDAVSLLSGFRQRPDLVSPDYLERHLEVLAKLIALDDVSGDAMSELYTELLLVPLDAASPRGEEIADLAGRVREVFANVRPAITRKPPSEKLAELHAVLLDGDSSALVRAAVERSTASPVVKGVAVQGGVATIVIEAPPAGAEVTGARAEHAQAGRSVTVSVSEKATGVHTIQLASSRVADEGPWHVWVSIETDGTVVDRQLFLDGPHLVPPAGRTDSFRVRRPTTRQPLTVVRLGSVVRRAVRLVTG
ncbi:glycosyltransferase family 2 protein [Promicromonospora sp. CA-289599]|uniref:glycosyltransferase family 2 protein n=1 Tax=Promicromonospora sp. CA-289599 TaxID=3240014 RepID=UPI003D948CC5